MRRVVSTESAAGVAATSSVSEALVSCFQYNQAKEDPLAFAAAAELLIAAFDAPHPSLLALLMTGSSLEPECDKVIMSWSTMCKVL